MSCEEVRSQFADYVSAGVNGIDEPERSRFKAHLAACERCRLEAQELSGLWTRLGAIPSPAPSPQLQSRFQIMLEAYEHGLAQPPRAGLRDRWNSRLTSLWPWRPALQVGIAFALLVVGILVGSRIGLPGERPAAPNAEVDVLRTELSEMRQMVALSLMQHQSASDRLKGVNWSYELPQPDGEILTALLNALMNDPSVNVRLATVDALRQFGAQPVVRRGVVEAMAKQESPMVQIALIDLAVDLREKESIAALRHLAEDQQSDAFVRDHAQRGLAELE
jgi:hypothetical protein